VRGSVLACFGASVGFLSGAFLGRAFLKKGVMKKNQRTIKISGKYQARANEEIIVPEIKLSGKWLKESGFSSGRQVAVQVEKDRLVITLVKL
jgi:toxic protein SymE